MAADPVIVLEEVSYAWPGRPVCLDIPLFRLEAGERVFLHGPSGSGKSTLLNLIGGVLAPRSGSARVLGAELGRMSGAARDRLRADHIGFVFQQFNLIPYLSALDNVLLPCRFSASRRARLDGASPRAAGERLLQHLDLEPALWRADASALSVGQQQRVAAARALIGRPEIVVADEPTSALDEDRQAAFLDLLRRECDAAGSALLFVSHDRRLAGWFDRVVGLGEVNRAVGGNGKESAPPAPSSPAEVKLKEPSDGTTKHSTKRANDARQVAAYPPAPPPEGEGRKTPAKSPVTPEGEGRKA